MKLGTDELRELVAPAELEDVLQTLQTNGAVVTFAIYEKTTIITLAKPIEVEYLLKEACKKTENPRPFVQKKKA